MDYVYLDYAASAPMRQEALNAEKTYEASPIAGVNPNSLHSLGRQAARELDGRRYSQQGPQAQHGGFLGN